MENDHPVQVPYQLRADQKLKHVVQAIVQMPLQHWQAWSINHLSRKPGAVFDHPFSKEMLPIVQSKPPLCSV